MPERASATSSAVSKLESIHRRMAAVSEEEVLAALNTPDQPAGFVTLGPSSKTFTLVASEGEVHCESVSTRTA